MMIGKRRRDAYPIILSPDPEGGYYVFIPDFDKATQGDDIAEAMEMARDLIGLVGIDLEDDGKTIPTPNSVTYELEKDDLVTFVDIDFLEYRRKVDNRAVKKNCTIPYWLNVEAEKAGINFSKLLQDAIMTALGLTKAN